MDTSKAYFSENNTPYYEPLGQEYQDIEDDEQYIPRRPYKLVRQTNDWLFYFGNYPDECAFISLESQIAALIGKTGVAITRHVLQIPVENAEMMIQPNPLRSQIQAVKNDVCGKIGRIKDQIQIFADSGILTWTSEAGKIKLDYQHAYINVNFFVCDETGLFHVLISKPSRWMGEITYPEMRSLNNLIYVLRTIIMDHTLPFYENLSFELPEDLWHSLRSLTIEPTDQYLPESRCEVCEEACETQICASCSSKHLSACGACGNCGICSACRSYEDLEFEMYATEQ